MFMIEIAGVRILYTGDFSRQEDRHLMAAETPSMSPDVVIVESTYGVQIHEPRIEREARFTRTYVAMSLRILNSKLCRACTHHCSQRRAMPDTSICIRSCTGITPYSRYVVILLSPPHDFSCIR